MTVIIPRKVYLTVVAASVRFANARIPRNDWLEVSGVFIGRNEGDNVIITAAHPIMHQELDRNAVIDQYKWKNEDYVTFNIIDEEAYTRGEFAVGWWHSHPGFKIMMSHIDIKTTLFFQQKNPLAVSLVFNHERLMRQIEKASKKGDPDIQLNNDPGLKIFRLDNVDSGIEASYHTVDFRIEGYESVNQLITLTQKFVGDVTNLFPKDDIPQTYGKVIDDRIAQLNSLLVGTEEYLMTLTRRDETNRIPDVLKNQTQEIHKYVENTNKRLEFMKQFMDYLEFKEREKIIPEVETIISKWDDVTSGLDKKLKVLSKKF